jgi:citrate/tricarballylate utilization protein
VLTAPEAEVARQMQICNACRYCEGFCAVFPAMTRRLEFGKADIHYLANLCHNCGACLHACQYAPPHEFAVNVPQAMAQVRGQTYADFAWPPALGALYQRNGLTLSLALAAGLALFLLLALAINGTLIGGNLDGNFYKLFPHNLLVGLFAPVFLSRCWRWPWACAASGARCRRPPAARRSAGRRHAEAWMTCCASNTWTAAMARAATTPTTPGRCGAGAFTTSPSTVSCCALPPPAWPRCTTMPSWAGSAPYDLPSLPKLLGAVGRRQPADRARPGCSG